jgi:hypothetical protein
MAMLVTHYPEGTSGEVKRFREENELGAVALRLMTSQGVGSPEAEQTALDSWVGCTIIIWRTRSVALAICGFFQRAEAYDERLI